MIKNFIDDYMNVEKGEVVVKVDNVSKQYRLGAIGGATLREDLQSWWARVRKKEDPNLKIGEKDYRDQIGQKFYALDGINLEVCKQEALGIIGRNGAGKSTLLKLLSRVTAPTTGEIKMKGRIASMLEVGTGFHPELTGRENVFMNGAILGMTKKEIASKFDEIVEFAEMSKFIDTPVKRYSSGMYVKLAFSVAAHLDSEIMIMDEVLAVGDVNFQHKCIDKMSDVAKNGGKTILYVSHNMNTIRQLCDRCVVLSSGHLVYDGDVENAIGTYLGRINDEHPNTFILEELDREKYVRNAVKLLSFEFLDHDDNVYKVNDTVKFRVRFKMLEDVKKTQIKLIMRNVEDQLIGMSCSADIEGLEQGEIYEKDFICDFKGLASGKYYLTIGATQLDKLGVSVCLDCVERAVPIEFKSVIEEGKQVWNKRLYGHMDFGNIGILK